MSFLDMTAAEIKEEIRRRAKITLEVDHFKPSGVLTGIVEMLASVIVWIYSLFIKPIEKQISIDGAEGVFLDNWGLLLNVPRKLAKQATGHVTVSVYRNVTISKGSRINVVGSSLVFYTSEERSINVGGADIGVEAAQVGVAGGAFAQARGVINPVIAGIERVDFSNQWISDPGQDREKDDPYRLRIKERWIRAAVGDVPLVYEATAMSVQGVVEAKVFRAPGGEFGSFRIVCRGANNTTFAHNSDTLDAVRKLLKNKGLVARKEVIEGVVLQAVTVALTYRGDVAEKDVEAVVVKYFTGLKIGTRYSMQELYNLYDEIKITHVQFSAPIADDTTLAADAVYDYHTAGSVKATKVIK